MVKENFIDAEARRMAQDLDHSLKSQKVSEYIKATQNAVRLAYDSPLGFLEWVTMKKPSGLYLTFNMQKGENQLVHLKGWMLNGSYDNDLTLDESNYVCLIETLNPEQAADYLLKRKVDSSKLQAKLSKLELAEF